MCSSGPLFCLPPSSIFYIGCLLFYGDGAILSQFGMGKMKWRRVPTQVSACARSRMQGARAIKPHPQPRSLALAFRIKVRTRARNRLQLSLANQRSAFLGVVPRRGCFAKNSLHPPLFCSVYNAAKVERGREVNGG